MRLVIQMVCLVASRGPAENRALYHFAFLGESENVRVQVTFTNLFLTHQLPSHESSPAALSPQPSRNRLSSCPRGHHLAALGPSDLCADPRATQLSACLLYSDSCLCHLTAKESFKQIHFQIYSFQVMSVQFNGNSQNRSLTESGGSKDENLMHYCRQVRDIF